MIDVEVEVTTNHRGYCGVVVGTESVHKVSTMVRCHLHLNINHAFLLVVSNNVPVCKHTAGSLVGPGSIPGISTHSAFASHLVMLMRFAATEPLVVVIVGRIVKPKPPLRRPAGWLHKTSMSQDPGHNEQDKEQKLHAISVTDVA